MIELLDGKWAKRAAKAALVYKVSKEVYTYGQSFRSYLDNKQNYTVAVASEDGAFFNFVHEWVYSFAEPSRVKSVTLFPTSDSGVRSLNTSEEFSQPSSSYSVRVAVDDDSWQPLRFDSYEILFKVGTTPRQQGQAVTVLGGKTITFKAKNKSTQLALVQALQDLYKEKSASTEPKFNMFVRNSYGWNITKSKNSRPLESVVLRQGQLERIVNDIEQFLSDEDAYVKLGLPYHRGYLFYGPPGTGKTSLAKALADNFKMPVYYLPLSDVSGDTNFIDIISGLGKRGILLLEDIDVFSSAVQERDAEKNTLTMSGLLNALDGIATPLGMITIMTTNHIDKIDPAVIRAGRIDLKERLGEFDVEQLNRYFEAFYGRKPVRDISKAAGKIPADVAEIFKLNMHDPDSAELMLVGSDS